MGMVEGKIREIELEGRLEKERDDKLDMELEERSVAGAEESLWSLEAALASFVDILDRYLLGYCLWGSCNPSNHCRGSHIGHLDSTDRKIHRSPIEPNMFEWRRDQSTDFLLFCYTVDNSRETHYTCVRWRGTTPMNRKR